VRSLPLVPAEAGIQKSFAKKLDFRLRGERAEQDP